MDIQIKTFEWVDEKNNTKKIAYTNLTNFYIQIGKGRSAYRNRYTITGDIGTAWKYYQGINIGNGYKKRIVMDGGMGGKFLHRMFS